MLSLENLTIGLLLPVATSCRLNFGAFNLDNATYAEFLLHGTGFFFIKP
jgi:hypothetical protein